MNNSLNTPMQSTRTIEALLEESTARHSHLCPRQVLGVRVGLAGPEWLGLSVPRDDKRLLVIVETDGCFTDGVEVASGVTVGQRRLRIEDYGKVAATFIDTQSGLAVRVAPNPQARFKAEDYAPQAANLYDAQLYGYQIMPSDELLLFAPVQLVQTVEDIISLPGLRVECEICGEEIMNDRQVDQDGRRLCRACAGYAYYTVV